MTSLKDSVTPADLDLILLGEAEGYCDRRKINNCNIILSTCGC